MSIVLRENEWAENMIRTRSLGNKPYETLKRVARYYIDSGYDKRCVRAQLESFLIQCDPCASTIMWADTLEYAIKSAYKYKAIDIDKIEITRSEMEKIDSLEGKQIRRLAFTLLCLSKYWLLVNPQCDYWIRNKDSEIMAMANINTSVKRQSLMYRELRDAGLIQFSKKVDNTNVRVCFAGSDDVALVVSDFRNLGYQYLLYHGEPYFECQNCGIVSKIGDPVHGKKQKYCRCCASEIALQQRVNSVMKHRYS